MELSVPTALLLADGLQAQGDLNAAIELLEPVQASARPAAQSASGTIRRAPGRLLDRRLLDRRHPGGLSLWGQPTAHG